MKPIKVSFTILSLLFGFFLLGGCIQHTSAPVGKAIVPTLSANGSGNPSTAQPTLPNPNSSNSAVSGLSPIQTTGDLTSNQVPRRSLGPPKFAGFIVKFKEQSVIEKKKLIQKELGLSELKRELKKSIAEKKSDAGQKQQEVNVLEQQVQSETAIYEKQLENDHADHVQKLGGIIPDLDKKIERNWSNVLNGFSANLTTDEAAKISDENFVEKVYPNIIVKSDLVYSVPTINANALWNLKGINGNPITGKGIKIAIIDTGVDYTTPMFGSCTTAQYIFKQCPKVVGGYDFVNNDLDPMDDQGHGTHVAGIAAGNSVKLKGVAPEAIIVPYKVMNNQGSGTTSNIISAMEKAVDPNNDGDFSDHVDVATASLGGFGYPDDALSIAFNNAVDSGVVVTVAAGNSGDYGYNTIDCPGCASKVITVGASFSRDELPSYTSKGPVIFGTHMLLKPEIVAPGDSICSANLSTNNPAYNPGVGTCSYSGFSGDTQYTQKSGTSMATPHVAGVAALLLQSHPNWTPEEIKSALVGGAHDMNAWHQFNIYQQGSGRVDAIASNSIPVLAQPATINFGVNKLGVHKILNCSLDGSTNCSGGETPVLSHGISFDSGHSNQSVLFALGDVLRYDSNGNFDSEKGTIDFWVKLNFNPKTAANDKVFFDATDQSSTLDNPKLKYDSTSHTLRLKVDRPGGKTCMLETKEIQDWNWGTGGEWHRITATWDAGDYSANLQLFIDGNQVEEHVNCDGGNPWTPKPTSNITIGSSSAASNSADSWIDEFTIYDHAIAPDETSLSSTKNVVVRLKNIDSQPWGVRLAEKEGYNIDLGTQHSGIIHFLTNDICIPAGGEMPATIQADRGSVPGGVYSIVVTGSLYQNCDFTPPNQIKEIRMPAGFSNYYETTLIFVDGSSDPPNFDNKFNIWGVIKDGNLLYLNGFLVTKKEPSYHYTILSPFSSYDLVGESLFTLRGHLESSFYLKHVNTGTENWKFLNKNNTTSMSNMNDILSNQSLQTYMVGMRVDLLNDPSSPNSLTPVWWDYKSLTGRGPFGIDYGIMTWDINVEADNDLESRNILLTAIDFGQNAAYYSLSNHFGVLSSTIPYPYTSTDPIPASSIRTVDLNIGNALVERPTFDQNGYVYNMQINAYYVGDQYYRFNIWSRIGNDKHFKGTFTFRENCPFCNYYLSPEAGSHYGDIQADIFNGIGDSYKQKNLVIGQNISVFEDPLYLDLTTQNCPSAGVGINCGHPVLMGKLHDNLGSGTRNVSTYPGYGTGSLEQLAGSLKITPPNGTDMNNLLYTAGVYANNPVFWVIDCNYSPGTWEKQNSTQPPMLQDQKFCQPGNYSIHWVVPNLSKTRTLRLDANVFFDGNNWAILSEYSLCKDNDGDGYSKCSVPADCDDTNPRISPKATEICNKIDDNCNGKIDEGIICGGGGGGGKKIPYVPV